MPRPLHTTGYVPLLDLKKLTGKSLPWIRKRLSVYRETKRLAKKARRWQLLNQALNTKTKYILRNRPRYCRHPITVLQYLRVVGVPNGLANHLLWDALREDWLKQAQRKGFKHLRACPLPIWAKISDPSWPLPHLMPPPAPLKSSITFGVLPRTRNKSNSTPSPSPLITLRASSPCKSWT